MVERSQAMRPFLARRLVEHGGIEQREEDIDLCRGQRLNLFVIGPGELFWG